MRINIGINFIIVSEANKSVFEYVAHHNLRSSSKNEKLYIYGTRDELYFMLFKLAQDYDIELV